MLLIPTGTHDTPRGEWGANGFDNRTDSSLTWTDSTPDRTLSVQPTASSFSYWIDGVRYDTSGDTVQITDVEGVHVVYYDGATLTALANPTVAQIDTLIRTKALVSIVYWDTSAATAIYVGEERHGKVMAADTHAYLHSIEGLQYLSGLGLNGLSVDGTGTTADAQFGVDVGAAADEDIYHAIAAIGSTVGLPIYYMLGASADWQKHTEAGFSARTSGGTSSTRLAWNEYTGGAWQLTEADNGNFVLSHIFATTEKDYPMIVIMGQASYSTRIQARAGALTEIRSLVLNNVLFPEIRPIATVIYQTGLAYASAINALIVSTGTGDDYVDWRSETIDRTSVSTSDHAALTGLTIGDDHTHYSLVDGTKPFTGVVGGVTPVADADLSTKKYVDDNLHDAVTIADTSTVDLSLVGQAISAAVIPGGISHTDITDIGSSTHGQIDTHLGAAAPHSGHAATSHTHTESDVTDLDHDDLDAIHDNVASEISAVTEKVTPISADLLLIEDSADANAKKRVQVGNLPGGSGTDADAIHDNVASEISAVTEKVTPISADLLLIEDSADSNAKKRVQIGNLPGGSGSSVEMNRLVGDRLKAPEFFGEFRSIADDEATTSLTLAVTVPAGVVSGDLLLAVLMDAGDGTGNAANLTTPAGWTLQNSGNTDLPATASTPAVWIFTRTAGGSEPATYTFTSDMGDDWLGCILAYSDVETTIVDITSLATGSDDTPIAPAITTTAPAIILRISVHDNEFNAPLTYPDTVQRIDKKRAGTSGASNGCYMIISESVQTSGAAAGTGTFGLTASEEWGAISLAIGLTTGSVDDVNAAEITNDDNQDVVNFDDDLIEGVLFSLSVPTGVTDMNLALRSRAKTAPGGAVAVGLLLYNREFIDNAADEAWTSDAMTDIALPANTYWQQDTNAISLATLGITAGSDAQFMLVRNTADVDDDLVGDWQLGALSVYFD